jgi:hypothetical protein
LLLPERGERCVADSRSLSVVDGRTLDEIIDILRRTGIIEMDIVFGLSMAGQNDAGVGSHGGIDVEIVETDVGLRALKWNLSSIYL